MPLLLRRCYNRPWYGDTAQTRRQRPPRPGYRWPVTSWSVRALALLVSTSDPAAPAFPDPAVFADPAAGRGARNFDAAPCGGQRAPHPASRLQDGTCRGRATCAGQPCRSTGAPRRGIRPFRLCFQGGGAVCRRAVARAPEPATRAARGPVSTEGRSERQAAPAVPVRNQLGCNIRNGRCFLGPPSLAALRTRPALPAGSRRSQGAQPRESLLAHVRAALLQGGDAYKEAVRPVRGRGGVCRAPGAGLDGSAPRCAGGGSSAPGQRCRARG